MDRGADYARENPVDLVIADVNMPRGRHHAGERAAPAARQPADTALLLTTESSMEKKMEGKKPALVAGQAFHPAQLLATLARVL